MKLKFQSVKKMKNIKEKYQKKVLGITRILYYFSR